MNKKLILLCSVFLLTLFLLCSCSIEGEPPAKQGNALVTGEKRDDASSSAQAPSSLEAQSIIETTIARTEPVTQNSCSIVKTPDIKAINPNKTFTGLKPLALKEFKVCDPKNERHIPTKSIEHSFGIAKDSKPNDISLNAQKFFDSKNFNAVCVDTKTTDKKVLYLTFDCGWENGYTGKVLDVLKQKNVPAAFFCTLSNIEREPELIARMINEGHIVGNHSDTHPRFSEISREKMALEIARCDNFLRVNFGYSSPFFRFPEGNYSECALDLVGSLGYKSVFWSVAYADWDVNKQKGADYAFETVTARLHPGAVILLHSVSPDNAAALPRIIDWARENGYEFKSLTQCP